MDRIEKMIDAIEALSDVTGESSEDIALVLYETSIISDNDYITLYECKLMGEINEKP